ncbi:MAG: GDP-mannose 4,6-dehydratase [Methanoregulaceae archaeon]|jgi:UDP-glucose 4-epimerase
MKALVTGCAGFIGSHVVDRLLDEKYVVLGIDRFSDYYERSIKEANLRQVSNNPRFTLIDEDILKISEFPKVDYIFHLAAQAGVRSSWGKSFEIYLRDNVGATQKLLEFYKDKNIKKFVYSSSSSVYGNSSLPMREDIPVRPISPYGVTKLAAENLCYLYYLNYGVPTVSLRYFTVYGPRQRPDMAINKFTSAIREGRPIPLYGDGTQTRDFTFVTDIVEANLLAAHHPESGEIYNIGGGNRISVNDIIKEIENGVNKKALIQHIEFQKGDVQDTLADTTKAGRELGWRPRVPISEGMEKYLRISLNG